MKIFYRLLIFFLVILAGKSVAQVYGCTDPLANNYNPSATVNNGSCTYNSTSISPVSSYTLSSTLAETSGLIRWDNLIWTHNDSDDINLYGLDSLNGNILQTQALTGTQNTDWEEISQDEDYLYIGDFGNNSNGNRTDLKILRISKTSFVSGTPVTDTISFSYADQVNFNPTGGNNTDFDCEAFMVTWDSIFLFTKQWVSRQTKLYALPKTPGTYTAQPRGTLNVQGLITGATSKQDENIVVLSGYSNTLQPFIYLLYDYTGNAFFNGNKRKIQLSQSFHQVEGIATNDGLKYYISNEAFSQFPFNVQQKLQVLNLSSYLSGYINSNNLPSARTLSLGVFLESLYNGTGMNKSQNETGDQYAGTVADEVSVELHHATSPYALAASFTQVPLNTGGSLNVTVPVAFNGSYYIVVKHRNSVETWSAQPVSFNNSVVTYDFRNAASSAYGGNLKQTGNVFAIFSGDVNQDGSVDTADMTPVDNDAGNYASGYLPTDANGDGTVDTSDMTIVDNNAAGYVVAQHP